MRNLIALLEELQGKLERFRKDGLKETPTRTIFIDPILEALGWNVRDPDEVQLEYPTVDGKSVDYALKIERKPALLVEAKSLNDLLKDVKDVTQATGYAANDGITWCILTNGVRWRVYRSIEQCPAPEKLLFEVSYDPADLAGMTIAQAAEHFHRFSREQLAKGVLDELGQQTFTDSKVRRALQKILADPPRSFLKVIREVAADESLRPQGIRESLSRVLGPMLSTTVLPRPAPAKPKATTRTKGRSKSMYTEAHHIQDKPLEVLELYRRLDQFCLALRPGAIEKHHLAKYIAYSVKGRTFCCIHLQRAGLRVWLKLRYQDLSGPPDFARDVSKIGHWGTGNLELTLSDIQQLAEAEELIRRSHDSL